jgi:hypothetical protein
MNILKNSCGYITRYMSIQECSMIARKMQENRSDMLTECRRRDLVDMFLQNKLYTHLKYFDDGLVTEDEYVAAVSSAAVGIAPSFYFGNVPQKYITKEFIMRCIDAAKTRGGFSEFPPSLHISMLPRHFLEDPDIQEAFLRVGIYDVTGIENLTEKTWRTVLKADPEQIHNIKNRTDAMRDFVKAHSTPYSS